MECCAWLEHCPRRRHWHGTRVAVADLLMRGYRIERVKACLLLFCLVNVVRFMAAFIAQCQLPVRRPFLSVTPAVTEAPVGMTGTTHLTLYNCIWITLIGQFTESLPDIC
jgi:hypothetical protein